MPHPILDMNDFCELCQQFVSDVRPCSSERRKHCNSCHNNLPTQGSGHSFFHLQIEQIHPIMYF